MSLQIWLPLTEDTITNKGLWPITWSRNNTTLTTGGKVGEKCKYINSNTYSIQSSIITPKSLTQATIAAWIRPHSRTAIGYLFGFSNADALTDFYIARSSNSNARFSGYCGSTELLSNSGTQVLNAWTHLALTYDGVTASLYINGTLVKSTSVSHQFQTNNTFIIGARSGTTTGTLYSTNRTAYSDFNDVRYYDHCLSAAEVKEIAQGLVLHYKLDLGGMNNLLKNSNNFTAADFACTRSTVPSNGILQVTPTSSVAYAKYITDLDYELYNNNTYTVSYDMQEIEPSVNTYTSSSMRVYYGYSIASRSASAFSSSYDRYAYKTVSTIGSGWHHYSVSFSIPDGLTTGKTAALTSGSNLCVEFYRVAKTVPVQIKNIKLEIGNKDTGYTLNLADLNINPTIIEDSSGYKNRGEIIGTVISSPESPRYIQSLYFNNAPYIRKTNFNFVSNEWTISAWFKKTSAITSSFETICGLTRDVGTDANKKFSIYIYNNQLGFVGEGTAHSNITTTDISIWHHVCVTNSQGTYKYYLDGELIQTYTNSNNLTDCTDFVVGARSAETGASSIATPWGGYISDVRLYCTPLLDNEVKQLYNISMRIDNKNNIHTFEIIENNKNKINKHGQLMCNEINEINFTANVKNFSNNNWQAHQIIER